MRISPESEGGPRFALFVWPAGRGPGGHVEPVGHGLPADAHELGKRRADFSQPGDEETRMARCIIAAAGRPSVPGHLSASRRYQSAVVVPCDRGCSPRRVDESSTVRWAASSRRRKDISICSCQLSTASSYDPPAGNQPTSFACLLSTVPSPLVRVRPAVHPPRIRQDTAVIVLVSTVLAQSDRAFCSQCPTSTPARVRKRRGRAWANKTRAAQWHLGRPRPRKYVLFLYPRGRLAGVVASSRFAASQPGPSACPPPRTPSRGCSLPPAG